MNKKSLFSCCCCVKSVSLILCIFLIYASWQLIAVESTRGWGVCLLCSGTLLLYLAAGLCLNVIEIRNLLKSCCKDQTCECENTCTCEPASQEVQPEAPAESAESENSSENTPSSNIWLILYLIFAVAIVGVFAYFISH